MICRCCCIEGSLRRFRVVVVGRLMCLSGGLRFVGREGGSGRGLVIGRVVAGKTGFVVEESVTRLSMIVVST